MKPLIISLFFLFFAAPSVCLADGPISIPADTVKYKGYRLELTNFRLIKKKDDWIKVGFDVVNSGRMNVDMSRKGTEYWVVFNFDQSIYSIKLGGYREHIKQQLAVNGFKLEKGKLRRDVVLKVPTVLPTTPKQTSPPVVKNTTKKPSNSPSKDASKSLAWNSDPSNAPSINDIELTEKGSNKKKAQWVAPPKSTTDNTCPDIFIAQLKIIKQDSKHAIVEYTVTNQGTGSFYLFGKNPSQKDPLFIKSYMSGVTTLTRGALPIGGEAVDQEIRKTNELKKGESFTGRIKVDIRKKTRYMKSLILSLESSQFAKECDRKNNNKGVVLN